MALARRGRDDEAAAPDPAYLAFAQVRQPQLLQAAFLLCGDVGTAARLVREALRDLARDWGRDEDDPALLVRVPLYRGAVALLRKGEGTPPTPVEPFLADPATSTGATMGGGADDEHRDEEVDEEEVDVLGVLGLMPPRDRAALVLRWFEERTEYAIAEILDLSPKAVPAAVPPEFEGRNVRALLEHAAKDVEWNDLAAPAWEEARRVARSRRRAGLGVVAAMVVIIGIVVGLSLRGVDEVIDAGPDEVPTLTGQTEDGVRFRLAPAVGEERLQGQIGTRLVDDLQLDGPTEFLSARLPDERGVLAEAAMVFLRGEPDGSLHPVIVTPDGALLEADELVLKPAVDDDGNRVNPLSTAGVTPDGHRIAFAQPSEVVILDVTTGEVQRIPVPSKGLEDVGWGIGRVGLIASDSGGSWFIDAETAAVSELPARASAGHYRLVADLQKQRPMALQTWNAYGEQSAEPLALGYTFGQVTGATVASLEGRAATSVFVDPRTFGEVATTARLRDAIFVVQADVPSTRTILAFPDQGSASRAIVCCTPLAWAGGSRLLYLSTHSRANWIMAWDTIGGDVRGVTRVTGDDGTGLTLVIALGRLR